MIALRDKLCSLFALPSGTALTVVYVDEDDVNHPIGDDDGLNAAAQHAKAQAADRIALTVDYLSSASVSSSSSAAAAAAAAVRRPHSAPTSPQLGSVAVAPPNYAFGDLTTAAATALPSWTELLPNVISFFDDHHVQQGLRRSAPACAAALRSGSHPRSVMTNLLALEPAVAAHPLMVQLLPHLPSLTSLVTRAPGAVNKLVHIYMRGHVDLRVFTIV